MTLGEGSTVATAGVIVGSVFKEMFVSMFKKMLGHKNGNGNSNGNGSTSSSAVVDAIQHAQVTSILDRHTDILGEIKSGITELVVIMRERKE